jgi:choline dehydrogenase-like flavoprotein
MIDSLTRHIQDDLIETDICVIGGGPVGISLVSQFVGEPTRVLLLESGGESPNGATQSLNAGAIAGGPFTTLEDGRVRAFGGTTWNWAGQCLPLDDEVFERRTAIEATGWPFGALELEPYTERAARFFGIPHPTVPEEVWAEFDIPPPALDTRLLIAKHAAYAHPLNVGPEHLRAFRRSEAVTLMLHSTVIRLDPSGSGNRIEQVRIANLDGARAQVRARVFVLCCGAIENARLLLLTHEIASRNPTIGRFFQNHLRGVCARLEPVNRRALQDQFTTFRRRGRRYLPRLALSPDRQREAQVLASHANLAWTPPPSIVALRDLQQMRSLGGSIRNLGRVLRDLPELGKAGIRRARGLGSAPSSGEMWLVIDSEQAPDRHSRVSLGSGRDAMGQPEAVVDWRLGELERRTMRAMTEAVSTEFQRLALAVVRPTDWLDDPQSWAMHVTDTAHHSGTTRIGPTPADGVVDANCRVHGTGNLFVAGSSVFPTSGAANPTLAAVALALRLADHLKDGAIQA